MNIDNNGDFYRPAVDWVWHPFGRSLGVGIITGCFTSSCFTAGLIYGGISGFTNLGSRIIQKQIDIQPSSPELAAVNYLFCATFPWIISAKIMKQAYKNTGKEFFYMSPRAAIGIAVATEIFGNFNKDLLIDDKLKQDIKNVLSKE